MSTWKTFTAAAVVTASLTAGLGLPAAVAGAQEATPPTDGARGAELCATVDERRADLDERLARFQERIDRLQDRLAQRLERATARGATGTVSVVQARLDRLAEIEASYPARVQGVLDRVDQFCAELDPAG